MADSAPWSWPGVCPSIKINLYTGKAPCVVKKGLFGKNNTSSTYGGDIFIYLDFCQQHSLFLMDWERALQFCCILDFDVTQTQMYSDTPSLVASSPLSPTDTHTSP